MRSDQTRVVFTISKAGADEKAKAGGVGTFLQSKRVLLSALPAVTFGGIFSLSEKKDAEGKTTAYSFVHSRPDGQIVPLWAPPFELVTKFLSDVNVKDWFEHHPGAEHWAVYEPNPQPAEFDGPLYTAIRQYSTRAAMEVADTIIRSGVNQRNVIIWVNDFQTWAMIPELRQRMPWVQIIYQHHIPFPHHIPNHRIPYYRAFLEALTDADCIIAHITEYLDALMAFALRTPGFRVDHVNRLIFKTNGSRVTKLVASVLGIYPEPWANWGDDTTINNFMPAEMQSVLRAGNFAVHVARYADPTKWGDGLFQAIEMDFEKNPDRIGHFTHLVVGTDNRVDLPSPYGEYWKRLEDRYEVISKKFNNNDQPPLVWLKKGRPQSELARAFAECEFQSVPSRRDGFNLVAAEGVAARLGVTLRALQYMFVEDLRKRLNDLPDPEDIPDLWDSYLEFWHRGLSTALRLPGSLWGRISAAVPMQITEFWEIAQDWEHGREKIRKPGRLILSDRAGAWRILRDGVISIAPDDPAELQNAFDRARTMQLEDCLRLSLVALSAVYTYTLDHWFNRVVRLSGVFGASDPLNGSA
jgi:trehalose-6-phosphate synthase